MLSGQEQFTIATALAVVLATAVWAAYRPLARWVSVLIPVALFLLLAAGSWTIFEPRFHLNFYGNGFTCWTRSIPAALAAAALAFYGFKIDSRLSCALLGATAAIIAQTIYCPIVESRHIAIFHDGQLLLWPFLLSTLKR